MVPVERLTTKTKWGNDRVHLKSLANANYESALHNYNNVNSTAHLNIPIKPTAHNNQDPDLEYKKKLVDSIQYTIDGSNNSFAQQKRSASLASSAKQLPSLSRVVKMRELD